jgi:hypothetical protein
LRPYFKPIEARQRAGGRGRAIGARAHALITQRTRKTNGKRIDLLPEDGMLTANVGMAEVETEA